MTRKAQMTSRPQRQEATAVIYKRGKDEGCVAKVSEYYPIDHNELAHYQRFNWRKSSEIEYGVFYVG